MKVRKAKPRRMLWVAAAGLFLAPLIAMQFTDEVAWDGADFAAFGMMLILACSAYEFVVRLTTNRTGRAVAGLLILATFFLIWLQLAVGIIGG
jgi:peptidoglycan/LPS O-acetylase OafA/YrhL